MTGGRKSDKHQSALRIREANSLDADALGLVMVSAFYSAFIGVVPEADLDLEWTPSQSAASWRRHFTEQRPKGEFLLVAEQDSKVVGLALAGQKTGIASHPVKIGSLQVLPSLHGQGIGRALVAAVAQRLIDAGHHSMLIGCARENPNCAFYKALGGVEHHRGPCMIDAFRSEEIFFAWDDLDRLT